MAVINFGGVKEKVVIRKEFPMARARKVLKKETIAIREARKLGIPIIGLVDTNSNPDELDYPVPANDDAIRSVKLFTKTFSDAIIEGRGRYMKSKEFLADKAKKDPGPPKERGTAGKREEPKQQKGDARKEPEAEKKPPTRSESSFWVEFPLIKILFPAVTPAHRFKKSMRIPGSPVRLQILPKNSPGQTRGKAVFCGYPPLNAPHRGGRYLKNLPAGCLIFVDPMAKSC